MMSANVMNRGQPDPFAEHVSVMKALYQEYQKKDEADGIEFLGALLAETRHICSQRENAAKELIRGAHK